MSDASTSAWARSRDGTVRPITPEMLEKLERPEEGIELVLTLSDAQLVHRALSRYAKHMDELAGRMIQQHNMHSCWAARDRAEALSKAIAEGREKRWDEIVDAG